MTNELLRQQWRKYWKECHKISVLQQENPDFSPLPYPDFPEQLHGLCCGAHTRAGTPCKRIDLYTNGRCKFHGGLSTGPITKKGKATSRRNGRKGGRPKNANTSQTSS